MKKENKIKDIIIGVIILFYIIVIGDLIINHENYIFKEQWTHLAIVILLCIGFYYFVRNNRNE